MQVAKASPHGVADQNDGLYRFPVDVRREIIQLERVKPDDDPGSGGQAAGNDKQRTGPFREHHIVLVKEPLKRSL